MSKFWSVRNKVDSLSFYAYAPNRDDAIKVVEALMGPMNPSHRMVTELVKCPAGFARHGEDTQILDATYEDAE